MSVVSGELSSKSYCWIPRTEASESLSIDWSVEGWLIFLSISIKLKSLLVIPFPSSIEAALSPSTGIGGDMYHLRDLLIDSSNSGF